jgi:hypothetical protein
MILNISELEFFIFLKLIIYMRASSKDFIENHQFNVILPYFKQIIDSSLFNITYLHTTCTIFLEYVDFSWHFFVIINCLALYMNVFLDSYEFFLHKMQI